MASIFVWVLVLASQSSHSITVHGVSMKAHCSPLAFFLSLFQDAFLSLLLVLWSSLHAEVQLYSHSRASSCSPDRFCWAQLTDCLNTAFYPCLTCTEVATSMWRWTKWCSHLKSELLQMNTQSHSEFPQDIHSVLLGKNIPGPFPTSSNYADVITLCMKC